MEIMLNTGLHLMAMAQLWAMAIALKRAWEALQ